MRRFLSWILLCCACGTLSEPAVGAAPDRIVVRLRTDVLMKSQDGKMTRSYPKGDLIPQWPVQGEIDGNYLVNLDGTVYLLPSHQAIVKGCDKGALVATRTEPTRVGATRGISDPCAK